MNRELEALIEKQHKYLLVAILAFLGFMTGVILANYPRFWDLAWYVLVVSAPCFLVAGILAGVTSEEVYELKRANR